MWTSLRSRPVSAFSEPDFARQLVEIVVFELDLPPVAIGRVPNIAQAIHQRGTRVSNLGLAAVTIPAIIRGNGLTGFLLREKKRPASRKREP